VLSAAQKNTALWVKYDVEKLQETEFFLEKLSFFRVQSISLQDFFLVLPRSQAPAWEREKNPLYTPERGIAPGVTQGFPRNLVTKPGLCNEKKCLPDDAHGLGCIFFIPHSAI